MRKLVLHIGTAKTGTTTIQKLLHDKQTTLSQAGVYCPMYGRLHPEMGGHHLLPWSIRFPNRYDMAVWDRLVKELENTSALATRNIILSSEEFSSLSPSEILVVRRHLDAHDVAVVVYLRNQKDFMVSLYKQFIKTGHYHREFRDFCQDFLDRCKYAGWLEGWRSAFGPENVRVRLFDKVKGRLVSDFFLAVQTLEFDVTRWDQKDGVSPSNQATKILRFINRIEARLPYEPVLKSTSLMRRKLVWRTKIGRAVEGLGSLIVSKELYRSDDITYLREILRDSNQQLFDLYISPHDRVYFEF